MVEVRARAKLNLTLDVTGKRGGYHLLDSLVTTIGLADSVFATKRTDGRFTLEMRGERSAIPPEENNALRAAEAFRSAFPCTGASIFVEKRIPVAAGLGGSSADAAGVLLALTRLFGAEESALDQLADGLGSDVRYLLTGGLARMRGRGEKIEPLGAFPVFYALLLIPSEGVSTAECYKLYDTLHKKATKNTEEAIALLREGDAVSALKKCDNALIPAAERLCPASGEALGAARKLGPLGASMTGSGSGAFALFSTREECVRAAQTVKNFRTIVVQTE